MKRSEELQETQDEAVEILLQLQKLSARAREREIPAGDLSKGKHSLSMFVESLDAPIGETLRKERH